MRRRWLSWLMLAVWSTWLAATQGLLVAQTDLSVWVPDVGLVLLLVCAGRFLWLDVPKAAFILFLARVAFSVEPPAAVLSALLGMAILTNALRTVVEVNGPLARTVIAGFAGWALPAWLLFVHYAQDGARGDVSSVVWEALGMWRTGLVTAIAALFLGPALALLPGLSPLRKRRW